MATETLSERTIPIIGITTSSSARSSPLSLTPLSSGPHQQCGGLCEIDFAVVTCVPVGMGYDYLEPTGAELSHRCRDVRWGRTGTHLDAPAELAAESSSRPRVGPREPPGPRPHRSS